MGKVRGTLRKLARVQDLEKKRGLYSKARHYLSLGGGMQSSALFIRSVLGLVEYPIEAAIFADTGWERPQTYEMVEFLRVFGEKHGVPIYTVSNGNIHDDTLNPSVRAPGMPFYVKPLPVSVEEQREKVIEHFEDPDSLFWNLPSELKAAAISDTLAEFDARVARGEILPVQRRGIGDVSTAMYWRLQN